MVSSFNDFILCNGKTVHTKGFRNQNKDIFLLWEIPSRLTKQLFDKLRYPVAELDRDIL